MAFYCQLRCKCSGVSPDRQEPLDVGNVIYFQQSNAIDLPNPGNLQLYTIDQGLDRDETKPGRVIKLSQTLPVTRGNPEYEYANRDGSPREFEGRFYHYLTLRPEHEIRCDGLLPTFDLPAMDVPTEFDDLTHLCAVPLSGGNP